MSWKSSHQHGDFVRIRSSAEMVERSTYFRQQSQWNHNRPVTNIRTSINQLKSSLLLSQANNGENKRKQARVQQPTYADNVALPAFASCCCSNRSISRPKSETWLICKTSQTMFQIDCPISLANAEKWFLISAFGLWQLLHRPKLRRH